VTAGCPAHDGRCRTLLRLSSHETASHARGIGDRDGHRAIAAGVSRSQCRPRRCANPDAPPSLASTPALDEQFLVDLTNAGMRIADVPVAIAGAHDTCAFIAARHTAAEAMQTGTANNPTMTRADETAYVQAAIAVFCPRFLGMTDTLA
jgi:Protein of unknown function (DUF732)